LPMEARARAAEYRETCILARKKRYKHDTANVTPKRRKNIQSWDLTQLHVTYIGDSASAKDVQRVCCRKVEDLIRRPVKLDVANMWLRYFSGGS
jgi:hypothetical protein